MVRRRLIDAMSYQYLVGSELDYSEGLEGSRFVVNNPNATTTCGCGASFSFNRTQPRFSLIPLPFRTEPRGRVSQ